MKSLSPVSHFSCDIALLRLAASAYDSGFVEVGMLPPEGVEGDVLPNGCFCCFNGWGALSGKQGEGGVCEGPSWFQRDHGAVKAA